MLKWHEDNCSGEAIKLPLEKIGWSPVTQWNKAGVCHDDQTFKYIWGRVKSGKIGPVCVRKGRCLCESTFLLFPSSHVLSVQKCYQSLTPSSRQYTTFPKIPFTRTLSLQKYVTRWVLAWWVMPKLSVTLIGEYTHKEHVAARLLTFAPQIQPPIPEQALQWKNNLSSFSRTTRSLHTFHFLISYFWWCCKHQHSLCWL